MARVLARTRAHTHTHTHTHIYIYTHILNLSLVLYGCETWSLTLREEFKLQVFENKVLNRIFGHKNEVRNLGNYTGKNSDLYKSG
jgi:hypothetical protein